MFAVMNTRQVTDKFQDFQQRATEKARDVGETADRYVRENTWASIGVAAVLGCVVGFLLANRD